MRCDEGEKHEKEPEMDCFEDLSRDWLRVPLLLCGRQLLVIGRELDSSASVDQSQQAQFLHQRSSGLLGEVR